MLIALLVVLNNTWVVGVKHVLDVIDLSDGTSVPLTISGPVVCVVQRVPRTHGDTIFCSMHFRDSALAIIDCIEATREGLVFQFLVCPKTPLCIRDGGVV